MTDAKKTIIIIILVLLPWLLGLAPAFGQDNSGSAEKTLPAVAIYLEVLQPESFFIEPEQPAKLRWQAKGTIEQQQLPYTIMDYWSKPFTVVRRKYMMILWRL